MGIIVPIMGIRNGTGSPPVTMADALFSSTQQKVLARIFGQPERSYYAKELIAELGAGSGAVQRELKKLEQSGLVTVTWAGSQKHYQANPEAPIFHELVALIRKTVGLREPLTEALEPVADKVQLALVYGSTAKGTDHATSDIDLLLVADELQLEDLYALLATSEEKLGRSIHPTLYTSAEYRRRLATGNPFLTRILAGPTLVLQGRVPDVARSVGEPGEGRPAQEGGAI